MFVFLLLALLCMLLLILPARIFTSITEKQVQMISDMIHVNAPDSLLEAMWHKNIVSLFKKDKRLV